MADTFYNVNEIFFPKNCSLSSLNLLKNHWYHKVHQYDLNHMLFK